MLGLLENADANYYNFTDDKIPSSVDWNAFGAVTTIEDFSTASNCFNGT